MTLNPDVEELRRYNREAAPWAEAPGCKHRNCQSRVRPDLMQLEIVCDDCGAHKLLDWYSNASWHRQARVAAQWPT